MDPTPAALSEAFGKPVALPQTSFIQPSDAVSARMRGDCRTLDQCGISIEYPHGMEVGYWRWLYPLNPNYKTTGYHDAPAAADEFPNAEFVVLDRVAVLVRENTDEPGLGEATFCVHAVCTGIRGWENAGVLIDMAHSMLDQLTGASSGPLTAPPGVDLFPLVAPQKQVDLSDLSDTLGVPVVLPDTPIVRPSDAESAWAEGDCPAPIPAVTGCTVWVKFPSKSLTIVYRWPSGLHPLFYDGDPIIGMHILDLPGAIGAGAVDWQAEGQSLGWINFVLDASAVPAKITAGFSTLKEGPRVTISGDYDTATLQAIAQSIVDRWRAKR